MNSMIIQSIASCNLQLRETSGMFLKRFFPCDIQKYSVFNLKLDRQLSREYFTSDAIYNGSAGMTLYYYMCNSWQDC
jgi:hypothetical protein